MAVELKVPECPDVTLLIIGIVAMVIGALLDLKRQSIASKASARKKTAAQKKAGQPVNAAAPTPSAFTVTGLLADIVKQIAKGRTGLAVALLGLLIAAAGLLHKCTDDKAKSKAVKLVVASKTISAHAGTVDVKLRCTDKTSRCSGTVRLVSNGGRALATGPAVVAAKKTASVRLKLTGTGRASVRAHSSINATIRIDGKRVGSITISRTRTNR